MHVAGRRLRSMSDFWWTLLILLQLCERRIQSKHLDNDFRFRIDPQSIFFDSHIIPNGTEVSAYLLHNRTQRFFFILDNGSEFLSITVKPCVSALSWTISRLPLRGNKDITGWNLQSTSASSSETPLKTYRGHNVASFTPNRPEPGVYKVEVMATESDTYIRLFAKSTEIWYEYPTLPKNSKIYTKKLPGHQVKLLWKPSPFPRHYNQSVEYCVSINKRKSFQTRCGFLSYAFGDKRPRRPPHAGFIFAGERKKFREFRQSASPVKAARIKDFSYECVGNKTSYILATKRWRKDFFANVYVVNTANNKSSAYNSVTIKSKVRKKKHKLTDGKPTRISVGSSKQHVRLRFVLAKHAKEVAFSLYTCRKTLTLSVYNGKKLVLKSRVRRMKVLRLKNADAATYTLKISGRRNSSKQFTVLATSSPEKYSLPELPNDMRINVYPSTVGCNSVTIAWTVTSQRQKYCIYRKESSHESSRETHNRCVSPKVRKRKEKVLCKYFRYKYSRRPYVSDSLRGLKPNTNYDIDVYISKMRVRIPFRTARVRTKSQC